MRMFDSIVAEYKVSSNIIVTDIESFVLDSSDVSLFWHII